MHRRDAAEAPVEGGILLLQPAFAAETGWVYRGLCRGGNARFERSGRGTLRELPGRFFGDNAGREYRGSRIQRRAPAECARDANETGAFYVVVSCDQIPANHGQGLNVTQNCDEHHYNIVSINAEKYRKLQKFACKYCRRVIHAVKVSMGRNVCIWVISVGRIVK
jgi:hypothetical protein